MRMFNVCTALCLLVSAVFCSAAETMTLENENISVALSARGLSQIHDKQAAHTLHFDSDTFSLTVNDEVIESAGLVAKRSRRGKTRVVYAYDTGKWVVTVTYELKPKWRFVSKQLTVTAKDGSDYKVMRIKMFDGKLRNTIREAYEFAPGRSRVDGLSLRLKDEGNRGCFVLVQNPKTTYGVEGQQLSVSYDPDMNWQSKDGAFPSARCSERLYPGLHRTRLPRDSSPGPTPV